MNLLYFLLLLLKMNAKFAKPATKPFTNKSKTNLNSTIEIGSKLQSQTSLGPNSTWHKQKRPQHKIFHSQSQIHQNLELLDGQLSKFSNTPKSTLKSTTKDKTVVVEDEGVKKYDEAIRIKENQKDNIFSNKTKKTNQTKPTSNLRQENTKVLKAKRQTHIKFIEQKQTTNNLTLSNSYVTDITVFPFSEPNQRYLQLQAKLVEALNQNKELMNKIEHFKTLSQSSKKLLRDQIINFNLEGQQVIKNREAFNSLQKFSQKLNKENELLSQQKIQLMSQVQQLQTKIQDQTVVSTQLQIEKTNLGLKIMQIENKYQILKQDYEQYMKTQEQMQLLIALKAESMMHLPLQSKLDGSVVYFDQNTDLSINSRLKEDQIHINRSVIIQNFNQDPDFALVIKSVQDKYKTLIQQLKQRLINVQRQNFELSYENERQSQQPCQANYHFQISIDTDKRLLELQKANSGLKVIEYQLKQDMRRLKDEKIMNQLRVKQLTFEKQLQLQKLNSYKKHVAQKHQLQLKLLKRDNQQLKIKCNQQSQTIKALEKKGQQDAVLSSKLFTNVKKTKYFK